MQLERTIQKAHPVFMRVGPVILFQEPVLAVYYRIVRQYLDCLCSCAVHGYIICGSTVNSSGRKTLKPMVTSASLERMHPSSTDRIGNLLSSVAAFNIFLMNAFFK